MLNSRSKFLFACALIAAAMGVAACSHGGASADSSANAASASQPPASQNSAAVTVPKQAITQLAHLKLSGTAVKGGTDKLVFTTETEAYTTTGKDSVVDLATDWHSSEFNIIGDGGGSEATFNSGSSVTVKIALTDGSTAEPTCATNAGTTGETNNLNLKSCSVSGGSTPAIQFTESN